MAINAQHAQYNKHIDHWQLIEDITEIENLSQYLVTLNPLDITQENKCRNDAYKARAVFYALAQQTCAGMLGTLFKKAPVVNVPTAIQYVLSNADGAGNTLTQQASELAYDIIRKSRGGLFVTYPETTGTVSKADVLSGQYVATIKFIEAEQIINWKTETVGAVTRLSMVVIAEEIEEFIDYKATSKKVIRELFLLDGVFGVRTWEMNVKGDWVAMSEMTPTKHDGTHWNYIPFMFVGASNNSPDVDLPNMLGLCNLNIAHYRNSADYEDSVWYAGQSQPWMSGATQDHIDMMAANKMYVGSRMLLAVPDGGAFGFASAPPNPAVRQAMIDKVDMMIGVGARMIAPGGVAKTAEQTGSEREVQHSVLSLMAQNISSAYTVCLQWVAEYMGANPDECEIELCNDFIDASATPAELQQIITGFLTGAIPLGDYVDYMKRHSLFDDAIPVEDYAGLLAAPTAPLAQGL